VLNDWLYEGAEGAPGGPLPITRFRPNIVGLCGCGGAVDRRDGGPGGRIPGRARPSSRAEAMRSLASSTTTEPGGHRARAGHDRLRKLAANPNVIRACMFAKPNLSPDGVHGTGSHWQTKAQQFDGFRRGGRHDLAQDA